MTVEWQPHWSILSWLMKVDLSHWDVIIWQIVEEWSCRRDWIVKSSPFMGAQKLEHKPQKNNTSLLSNAITLHCMNCKNRYEWISWADTWNWICNLCKRSFLEDKHKMRTSRCVVWQIMSFFLPILYDIILVMIIHSKNLCWTWIFFSNCWICYLIL